MFTVVLLLLCAWSIEGTIVKTRLGLLEGTHGHTTKGREYLAFLGVPYAKPPVGQLRFKDPVFVDPWEGIREARTLPDYCVQKSGVQEELGNDPYVGTEDCLYLNIYIPKGKKNLPVMVYIHGGAFYRGAAREYGPNSLLDEDVILVIPNYRVGIFGFLSTEDSIIPGNFGLKDQQFALKWVHQNIDNFGGNPMKITLFGQSAGSASVLYQMFSPSSEGLFQQAILQSGSTLNPWAQSHRHRKFASEIGERFSCPLSDDSGKFLQCLQKVDAYDLLKYVSSTVKFFISPNWNTPRVDGNFLPAETETLLKTNRYHKMNIIAGIVKDEGSVTLKQLDSLLQNFEKLKVTSLALDQEPNKKKLAQTIYDRYFGSERVSAENSDSFVEMMSDRYFNVGHMVTVSEMINDLHVSRYLYEFDFKPDTSFFESQSDILGQWVAHAEELQLLFNGGGIFNRNVTSARDLKMKTLLIKMWTNFAKYGNPTPDDTIGFTWPAANTDLKYLHLTEVPRIRENTRQKDIDWWMSLPLEQNKLLKDSQKNEL